MNDVAKYNHLEELLDWESFRHSTRGCPELRPILQRLRRQVFLAYLKELERDFETVSRELRQCMLSSDHDRPDLARLLLRSSWTFWKYKQAARLRVCCFALGISGLHLGPCRALYDLQAAANLA